MTQQNEEMTYMTAEDIAAIHALTRKLDGQLGGVQLSVAIMAVRDLMVHLMAINADTVEEADNDLHALRDDMADMVRAGWEASREHRALLDQTNAPRH